MARFVLPWPSDRGRPSECGEKLMFKTDEEIDALLNKTDNLAVEIQNRPAPRRQLEDLSKRQHINDITPDGEQIVRKTMEQNPKLKILPLYVHCTMGDA